MTITLTAAPAPASAEAVAVHSGLAPATKVQLSPAGRWFEVLARRRRLSISISADQRKLAEEAEREAAGRVVEEESDGEEVEVGDVGQWKKQDHYALLGLSSKQWQATPEEIKKACASRCCPRPQRARGGALVCSLVTLAVGGPVGRAKGCEG